MGTLTTIPRDPLLDLDPWVGQRAASFRFYVTDAVTNERVGEINPIYNEEPPLLEHDTSRTIKRQLTISLGTADTAAINPLAERVSPYMVFQNGASYPLGRYVFSNPTYQRTTSGRLGTFVLNDEMFIVDQEIKKGISGFRTAIPTLIAQVVEGTGIQFDVENTPYVTSESWTVGTTRGQILEALSITGSYFSPWFGNDGKMHFIRAFDASRRICDLDFDSGNKVLRNSITETNDLLAAPNTFIVVANASDTADTAPVVGISRVAPTAPNSVQNRGFEIIEQLTMQVANAAQATAVAYGLAQRQSTMENVNLITAPDPRHDSYNVIRWDGTNWLEIQWTLTMIEGGNMSHTLRKTYGV